MHMLVEFILAAGLLVALIGWALATRTINRSLTQMREALAALEAAVAAETTITAGAVTLIQGLKTQLDAAIAANNDGDDSLLTDLSTQLGASHDALAQAVTANTPATPPAGDGSGATGGTTTGGDTGSTAATISISPTTLTNGTVGQSYTATLGATGGTSPYAWGTKDSLPDGLTLNGDGTITGTPSTAGDTTFVAVASDSATPANSGSQSYTLTVDAAAAE